MKVEWAEPAVRDMESIRDYIRRDSEHYAARFVEKIVDAVENLRLFPMMGRCVPEAEEENICEILFYNYRIIYCAEIGRIIVLGVIHGSRDISQTETKPWDVI